MVSSSGGRLWPFGVGILEGAGDIEKMWHRLTGALTATNEQFRQPLVLRGFLHALQAMDPGVAAKLLEEAVEHERFWRFDSEGGKNGGSALYGQMREIFQNLMHLPT